MAALVHHPLTNCQGLSLPSRPAQAGLFARLRSILRLWRRRAQERHALAMLSERELHDLQLSSSDVWHETRQPFWSEAAPYWPHTYPE